MGHLDGKLGGVDNCKKECRNYGQGCNAFDINITDGNCTLRECPLPMPLPDYDPGNTNIVGYVFKGIHVFGKISHWILSNF